MQNAPWASYSTFRAVTPSDTTSVTCRAIFVAVTGQITVAASIGGTPVSFGATTPVGTVLPIELNNGTINAATAATVVALA
jgi:hypothetical protein